MTQEDLQSELDKNPFTPICLHLVSGHKIHVRMRGRAELMRNSVLIFQDHAQADGEVLYDIISLRNIERIEQVGSDKGVINETE